MVCVVCVRVSTPLGQKSGERAGGGARDGAIWRWRVKDWRCLKENGRDADLEHKTEQVATNVPRQDNELASPASFVTTFVTPASA